MAKPDDQSGSSSRSASSSSSLSAAAAAAAAASEESDDDVGEDGDEDDTHKHTDADDGEKEATEDAVDDDEHDDDDDDGSINGLGHGTQDDDDDSSSDNTDPSKVAENLKTALEQLDLSTGKILASFSSYDEAFARVRHTSKNFQSFRAGIDNNVHGRAKSSVGYFWRHAGSNKIPPNSRRETGLAGIEQLDLWTGTVLASFSSYEEAFEHFRITSTNFLIFRTGIYNNIRGRSKSSLGYFWRHAGSNKLPYSFKRVSDGSDSSGKDDDRYQLEPPKTTVAGTSARSPASSKNGIKLTGTDQLDCDQDDESESESQDDQDQKMPAKLSIFHGSPYDEDDDGDFVSAEVREPLFEEFHNLLAPVSQSKSSTVSFSRRRNGMEKPSPAAIAKLGYETAYAMVTAKEQISLTGIAYSPEWLDSQRIRGNVSIPGLNASMILLGLRQERLCRADVAVLIRLSKELGVAGIVQKALGEWNWNEEFPELSSLSCHFSYKYDGRLAALKCQIFVARTYECMTLLDYHPSDDDDDEGIKMKLKACLQIMQVNLTGESIDLKDTGIKDAIEVRNRTSAGYFSRTHESSQPPELFMIHNHGFEKPRKKSGAAARPPNVRKRGGQKDPVAVEQLDLCTGKVLASYASMAAANASLGRYSHGGISDVVRGRTKSTAGYFWRRAGSQVLPDGLERDDADDGDASLSATEENNADDHLEEVETSAADDETAARPPNVRKRGGQKASVAVEQLDLSTGKVMASYASMAAANASLGRYSHGGISDVVRGRTKSTAGYFWRRAGSQVLPDGLERDDADGDDASLSATEENNADDHLEEVETSAADDETAARPPIVRKRGGQKASVAVEQLDLCTGKVMASYASMAAANASLGRYSHGGISDVVRGRTKSTAGYFWRRAGSQVLPDGLERDDADDDDASLSATEENNADDHLEEVETSAADDETAARPPNVRKRGGQKASVAVEQLDLCTGKVLASYASMAAANASLGRNSHGSISDVVRGKTKSTAGYFWRRAGSQVLPDGLERDDADGDDASLAAAKENNADDRQVNPRVQLPLQLSQSSAEKLPQEVNELRYVSPKSSSSRKSASGPPDRSTTSGESAGKAVASCTSVLPDNAAEFPYGLLEGDDDHDNKNTDNNEAEVKPAAAAGQVPVLHAESPSDDEESLESAPAAKKLPHTTKRVTHHGMVGNDTPPWKTQKRKEATTTPTPKPKPRMAVAAAVGQHPRTSLTTTNNNNNKNDKNTGTSSSAGRTRKRKRDKKLNAEELVDLMERQYKQSWRLFKKFRRAVRRTRGVVVDEGRQAGEVVL